MPEDMFVIEVSDIHRAVSLMTQPVR
jgi:hypothetical protein